MKMAASVVEPCASHQRHRGLKTAGSSRKALALPIVRMETLAFGELGEVIGDA